MLEQQAIVGKHQNAVIPVNHNVQEPIIDVVDSDDTCSSDEEDQRPVAQELYSGPRAPTLQALRWCGWRTLAPLDILLDGKDLAARSWQMMWCSRR